MGALMGGSSTQSQSVTAVGSLQIQTSCYGNPIPWTFGTNRVTPNVIQYEDFVATAQQSSAGGKGGHGSTVTGYTYTAATLMSICSGPINGVGQVWKDQSLTSLGELGLDLYTGTNTQTPYPYMIQHHPDRALGYRGICYVAGAPYDLGTDASIGNHSFEIEMPGTIPGLPDANVADVLTAVLTDSNQGLGLPAVSVGDLTQLSNFCLANNIWVSPSYIDQKAAYENIKVLLQIGYADCFRSNGVLNVVTYSDEPASSQYGTYTPSTINPLAITEDDILDSGDDPIKATRKSQTECFNSVQLTFADRANQYNDNVATATDLADIEQYGIRQMPMVDMHEICDANVANQVAQFLLQRSLNIRNSYEFKLPWSFCMLEPMDVLALFYPRRGYNGQVVMVTEIEEDEDGTMTVKAEDYPLGTNRSAVISPPTINSLAPNFSVDPGNATAPLMFEAPLQLTNNVPQIWLAAAGGANWGGADVWVSIDDATYQKVGRLAQPSRYGNTTNAVVAGGAIDTVTALGVNLNVSGGVLLSGTEQDAQNMVTACYLDGEYISYANAELTGVNEYSLNYLVRGAYGTPDEPHASGAPFARLDDSLFKYAYPSSWLGKTIWVKLVSVNAFGAGGQDISTVPAYTYAIKGAPLGVVQNLVMPTPWANGLNATVQWDLLPGASSYDVEIYAGTPAVVVRTVTGLTSNSFTYSPQDMVTDGGPWRSLNFYVRGRSSTGVTGGWATLLVTNPQIGALAGINVIGGIKTVFFSCAVPPQEDFSGVILWLSTDPTCPDVAANQIYESNGTVATIVSLNGGVPLVGGTTYYLRAAGYDTFGKDNLTVSASVAVLVSANAPDANTIQASMIQAGALTLTKFASGLQPVGIVSGLPSVTGYTGPTVVTNSVDGKLYRLVGGAWTSAVPTTDLSGQLTDAQLATISASKVTGQLTASQIASVNATQVAGQLTPAQISSIAATQVTGQLVDSQLSAISAGKISGQLTDSQISQLSAAKLAGQITSTQISNSAIGTPQLAAGAVTAVNLAAGSITANKLAVVPCSLSPDPMFESGPSFWGWWVQQVPASSPIAPAGCPGRLATQFNGRDGMGFYLDVTPGDVYKVTIWVNGSGATSPVGWVSYCFNSQGTNIPTYPMGYTSASGWQQVISTFTVPAGITRMQFGTHIEYNGGGSQSAWFSDFQIFRVSDSTLIQDGAITTAKLVVGSVTANILAANSVSTSALQAGAVTASNLAANSVTAGTIAAGAITTPAISAGAVTANQLAANSVTANAIAANSITTSALQAGAVTASNLAANSVTAGTIAAGAITTPAISAGAVTANQLAANSVTANAIAANSITTAAIQAGAVQASQIAAGAITANKLAVVPCSLSPDPMFESGASLWGAFLQQVPASSPIAPAGCPGRLATQFSGRDCMGFYLDVTPGDVYKVTIWVNNLSSGVPVGWVSYCYNSQGVDLAMYPSGTTTASGWQQVVSTFTVPSGVTQMKFGASLNQSWTATQTAWFSDFEIFRVSDSTLIQDGAISTSKIAAGAVTAAQILANTITSTQIAANTIVGGNIAANTITGSNIAAGTVTASNITVSNLAALSSNLGAVTAGSLNIGGKFIVGSDGTTTIQSSTTGQRSVMSNGLFQVYDSNNTLRVQLGIW